MKGRRYGKKRSVAKGGRAWRRRLQPGALGPLRAAAGPLANAAAYVGGRAAGYVAREAGAALRRYNDRKYAQGARRQRSANAGRVLLPTGTGEYNEAKSMFVNLNKSVRPIPARTLKLGFNKRILRFQRINTLTGANPPGYTKLQHGATAVDTFTNCPMYLFCLN